MTAFHLIFFFIYVGKKKESRLICLTWNQLRRENFGSGAFAFEVSREESIIYELSTRKINQKQAKNHSMNILLDIAITFEKKKKNPNPVN